MCMWPQWTCRERTRRFLDACLKHIAIHSETSCDTIGLGVEQLAKDHQLVLPRHFAAHCIVLRSLQVKQQCLKHMYTLSHSHRGLMMALATSNTTAYAAALQRVDLTLDVLHLHERIMNKQAAISIARLAQRPHCPLTHHLHGPKFRAAVKTMYLCNQRNCHVPPELLEAVTAFICRHSLI